MAQNQASRAYGDPMGMGIGWVWGQKFRTHGSPAKNNEEGAI